MPRFEVAPHNEVFFVRDNDHAEYGLPEKAVTLFFQMPAAAIQVALLLEAEWRKFLANPT